MTEIKDDMPEGYRQRVQARLGAVRQSARRLRRQNRALLLASVLASAGSTLVAGLTAAQGPVVLEGIPGWRLACSLAALFSFVATLTVGVHQQLNISEKLVTYTQSAGRLSALDIAIETGSRDWQAIAQEYEDIIRTYPEQLV